MRRWLWLLVVVAVIGIGVAVYMLKPVNGPARDLTLVGDATRGAYLIYVGGCVSCHTDPNPDGDRKTKDRVPMLSGGAGLASPFGTFYPPNITSHPTAGIGNWTLAQFSKAMSDGEGPQGHLYPAFPYDAYTLMSDQEIVDLYAALKEIPAVETPSKPHAVGFPFNIRLALAGWKNLFFHPRRFEPDTSKSEQWNRGAYLANGPSHCIVCHSPRNILGAIEAGKEFTGTTGGPGGNAPDITPAGLAKLGYTDAEKLRDALVKGVKPSGFDFIGGPMGEVINDGIKHWTPEDVDAVIAYLLAER